MKALRIHGGHRLAGRVRISGSKNAALPMMAASLLADGDVELANVPDLQDIRSMLRLLGLLGVSSSFETGSLMLRSGEPEDGPVAPYELVRTMRASVLVLGPLLVRFGRAAVSLPGGCAIGARPIDQHLKGLERLGARMEVREGYVYAEAPGGLRGATVTFDMPTVGGTENVMMAAAGAEGETILENAACEPEISALADLLREMGAAIEGDGTPRIRIEGRETLSGGAARVIPDRIETGTYLMAAVATGGDVVLEKTIPEHLDVVLEKLRTVGAEITADGGTIRVAGGDLRAENIRTAPHPGFPTDLQAQWMSLMTAAQGAAEIEETIFENRFMHVPELVRMGADIRVRGSRALVRGGTELTGAPVMATDLRASAGLVIAGLMAEGTTEVLRIYHLERGYEHLDEKLRALGAGVELFQREATIPHPDQVEAEAMEAPRGSEALTP